MNGLLKTVALGLLGLWMSLPGAAYAQTNSTVSVRLVDALSTGSSRAGDTFNATLVSPLVWQGRVVADQGEYVTGRVNQVVSSGWFKRPALISLSLGNAQSRSGSFPVQTGDLTIKSGSQAKRSLLIIGGTAALGAVVGGAAAGGKGAAIGAAAGAGAGTAGAYLAGNQEIMLPSETLLTFHVSSVTISTAELARLQRAASRNQRAYEPQQAYPTQAYPAQSYPAQSYPVYVRRRHHGEDEDDDDDDQGEDRGYYRERYPQRIDVFFISDHRARVGICWPERTEYIYLRGDDLDEIMEPLSERTHISIAVIRPRIHVRHGDDDRQ